MGTGRRIEAAKRGGREGLIGGDGRDSLRSGSFDVESLRNGSFDVDGIEGKGIVKGLIKHIELSVHASSSLSVTIAPGALARDIHRGTVRSSPLPTSKVATGPSPQKNI